MLKIDKDEFNKKDFRIYSDTTIDTVFNRLFKYMYYFQTTEMKSYLETFNDEIKKKAENFYLYNDTETNTYYYYKQLYKYLETVRDKFDTVELGNMHGNILGSLSMKIYASKRGRNVREDDPKDLKIWIDYKMEQIQIWFKKANAIKLDIISKCNNKVNTYQFKLNENSFRMNTTYPEYLNFILIISKIVPEIINKNAVLRLDVKYNKHLMPEHTIKLFSDRILKKGITADNISKYMPQLIKAWENYTE